MSAEIIDMGMLDQLQGDLDACVTEIKRLTIALESEQEMRRRAEAQRDRACKELRGFIAAAKLFNGFDESDSEYGQGAQDIAVEVADRARIALREIEEVK